VFQSVLVEREQHRDQKSLWQKLCPGYGSLTFAPCSCLVLNPHLLPATAAAGTLQRGSLPHSCRAGVRTDTPWTERRTWREEEKAKVRKTAKSAAMEE